jgi:hypothetical protein
MAGKGLGTWKTVLKGRDFKEGPDESLPPFILRTEEFKDGTKVFRDKLYPYLAGIYPDEALIQNGFMDLDLLYQNTDDVNIKNTYKKEREGGSLFDQFPTPLCGRKVFIIKFNVRDGRFVQWEYDKKKFIYSTKTTKTGDFFKTKAQYATGLNKKIGYAEQKKAEKSSSTSMFEDAFAGDEPEEEEEGEEEPNFQMNYQSVNVYFAEYLEERLAQSIKALSESVKPNFKQDATAELAANGFEPHDDNFSKSLAIEIDKQKLKWEKTAEIIHLFCISDMPTKQKSIINKEPITWWSIYVYDTFFLEDPDDESEDV